MAVVAIDFETANHRRDSACAVGLAWIEGGAVVRRASRLIRPPSLDFAYGNIRIHGIRPRDVAHAPTFPEAMAEFLPEIEGGLVLAHNAGFDVGVLVASLGAYGLAAPAFHALCTLQVSRRAWPGERRHGLAHAAARIGHSFVHHDAGEDAHASACVALAAVERLGLAGVEALPDALALDVRPVRSGFAPFIPRQRSDAVLAFAVEGRTGNAYAIDVTRRERAVHARCSCPAGRNNLRCRHVTALLDGEIGDLRSGNYDDVERLRRLVLVAGAVLPPEGRPQAAALSPSRG